jgi:hypothetical protein
MTCKHARWLLTHFVSILAQETWFKRILHIKYGLLPVIGKCRRRPRAGSSQGGLVYLKYTFWFRDQFGKPNDDWLDVVEATSDEMLGAYSKAVDEAMIIVFGARGKKRLNRVFDVIGFVYPNYCYPSRKQGIKRKAAISAMSQNLPRY